MIGFKKGTRRATSLTAMAAAGALAFSGVAVADDIYNDLDDTIDAVAEVMPLNVGGANGTTKLYVQPRNSDGKNGCNLTGGTTLGLSVSSSNTSVATVSPSSVTFTSCGDSKTLTVTPVAAGSATVSVSQTSNNTGGSFDLAPATFTVNVALAAPANTAPTISVTGVAGGASYDKGSVPAAICEVTDAEDGNSSFPATLSAVTGAYASDGIGSQTAGCSYTDGGGLTASASETYSIVDSTAPVIGSTLNPASPDGSGGWYRGNVSLAWSVTELESPNSLLTTGCVDQNITSDQAATSYSCSATSAGGSAAEQSVTIKRDGTAPTVSHAGTAGTLGDNSWYISDVVVTFTATDALSGPATASQTVSSSGEGSAVTVGSPAFSDLAGNTTAAGAVTETYKIDKTAPTTPVFIGGPTGGASYYFGDVPAAPTCASTDAVSGVVSCDVAGGGTSVGTHTYTATATDNAGHTTTSTLTYTVLAWDKKGFYSPVDMSGVWNTVKGSSTVPLKFELFAASELTSTSAVKSFTQKTVSCPASPIVDEIELVTTGGTSLRYDETAGQFVQNWQTPKKPGACYQAIMTAQDGSTISANFLLK